GERCVTRSLTRDHPIQVMFRTLSIPTVVNEVDRTNDAQTRETSTWIGETSEKSDCQSGGGSSIGRTGGLCVGGVGYAVPRPGRQRRCAFELPHRIPGAGCWRRRRRSW